MTFETNKVLSNDQRTHFMRDIRFGNLALQGAAILTGLGALYGILIGGRSELTFFEYWSAMAFVPFSVFILAYVHRFPEEAPRSIGLPVSLVGCVYVVANTWSVALFSTIPGAIFIHLAWGTPLSIFFFVLLSRSRALTLSLAATAMQVAALVFYFHRLDNQTPAFFVSVAIIWCLAQCVSIMLIFGVTRLLEANAAERESIRARLESTEKEFALLERFREQRNRYRRLIETSLDLVAEFSTDGTLIEVSQNCFELLGYTREELLGSPLTNLVHGPDADTAFTTLNDVVAGRPANAIEQKLITKDGVEIPILASAVYSPQDEVVFVIVRDLRERIAQEERARHHSRLEALGQLTGGIAHDFNNLLTVMYGEVERIEMIVEKNKILGIDLSRLIRATDGAVDLTRRLLTFSRKDPLYLMRTNLKVTIERAIELISSSIGNEYEIVAAAEDVWARVDVQELQAAIINLSINARDAMPGGGTIKVHVSAKPLPHGLDLPWGKIKSGNYAVIEIIDSGTGIPADMIANVVEPYFSTKGHGQGTGLGLSMALQLSEKLGGGLEITSEISKGTTVALYIPQDQSETSTETA